MPKLPKSVFKRGLSGKLAKIAGHPLTVLSVADLGNRIRLDVASFKRGEIDAQEWRARAGAHVGAVSGGVIGAIAISLIPLAGPILAPVAGVTVCEMGGSRLGRAVAERLEKRFLGHEPKVRPTSESA